MVTWLVWLQQQLLPIILFINIIQNHIFFFSDIQFCARSNFSKNSNECMSFLSTAECQLLTKKKGQTTILPGPITVPVSVWKTGYSSPSLSASTDTLG